MPATKRQSFATRHLVRPFFLMSIATASVAALAQNRPTPSLQQDVRIVRATPQGQPNADQQRKAAEWVGSLHLDDATKEARLEGVIAMHLKSVRDWHNSHPFSTVPAGINPATGTPLSDLDRQIIADSAMPKSVHEDLMAGLRKDLNEEQVEAILDRYTIGKVAFTMKGYHVIVPDLTAEEESHLLNFLKQAREQAVDFKNMKEISGIFEIYKTKCEQYLNANGRDWHQLYKDYFNKMKARKAAASQETKKD